MFVDCPIESKSDTHMYIRHDGRYVRRCDTNISIDEDELCEVDEDEISNILGDKSDEFCPTCLRYSSQLIA